ncbi:N-acetyltransferase [Halobacteriales archaeon QH_10_67_13]|nr:MAG: N-acetyltransferase [Halobacteriales archaeon QH_10_67_13]
MEEAGTDPADLPGVNDLRAVKATYLDDGDFVVGIAAEARRDERRLRTDDGVLVAMGGFLPSEAGHEDERAVAGAAELHRMRVAPTRQGSGHGRVLLETLEKRAAAGFDRLLATTAARQAAAVELYESAGYDRVGASAYGEYELRHFEKRLG